MNKSSAVDSGYRIVYNKKEQTTAARDNVDESHKYNVEWKEVSNGKDLVMPSCVGKPEETWGRDYHGSHGDRLGSFWATGNVISWPEGRCVCVYFSTQMYAFDNVKGSK